MNKTRMLAINPGTREIGVAVLADADLLYYAVKILKVRDPASTITSEAAHITRKLIATYEPHTIALIRPIILQPAGERLVAVIREIKQVAVGGGRGVKEYAPKTVRQFVCGTKRATKKEVARVLAARFPELSLYATGRSVWEELYYARMFLAVAAGLAHYYNMSSNGSPLHVLDVFKPVSAQGK